MGVSGCVRIFTGLDWAILEGCEDLSYNYSPVLYAAEYPGHTEMSGTMCYKAAPVLANVISNLRMDREKYKELGIGVSKGDVETPIEWCEKMYKMCNKHPDARIYIL